MQGVSQAGKGSPLDVTRPQSPGEFERLLSMFAGSLVIATLRAEQRQVSTHGSLVAAVADLLIDHQSLLECLLSRGEITQSACYQSQSGQAGRLAFAITGGTLERQRLGIGHAGNQVVTPGISEHAEPTQSIGLIVAVTSSTVKGQGLLVTGQCCGAVAKLP